MDGAKQPNPKSFAGPTSLIPSLRDPLSCLEKGFVDESHFSQGGKEEEGEMSKKKTMRTRVSPT